MRLHAVDTRSTFKSTLTGKSIRFRSIFEGGEDAITRIGEAAIATFAGRELSDARFRAEVLVAQMALEEKLRLVVSYFPLISPDAERLGMLPASGFMRGIPRLGIPDVRITDASLGVANALDARPGDTATALPSGLCTGASFDVETARDGGDMIGGEARAKGFGVMLAGGINLTRDPWAGRNFEYLGEDPVHSGLLGGAHVAGVQANCIAATVKHLALNAQETGRMVADARIDPTDLRESDLLAFEIAIETGCPSSVMTAYNKVNGEWCGEHRELITDILKRDWGFQGWVMSDWGAVHSTEHAIAAGLDQESGMELDKVLNGAIFFTDPLQAALEEGRIAESRIDEMAARVLTGLIEPGLLDNPVATETHPIELNANERIAQLVAERGIVLLKNDAVLPLGASEQRIAVIGGKADIGVLSGGGSSQVRSTGGVPYERSLSSGDGAWFCRETYHASSPLRAIRDRAETASVLFDPGENVEAAVHLASTCDVAIVFATQWCSEAIDALTLVLPDDQDALITAVAMTNPRTIVVLETGGPVLMPWLGAVAGVIEAWYPGQRGGDAIARVLFGDVNPSGRLPITFPASEAQPPRQVPGGISEMRQRDAAVASGDAEARIAPFAIFYDEGANVGYRWYEASAQIPLFPFGFGLSFTSFTYSDLRVFVGPEPRIEITVENTGTRAGADVPQVYVRASDRHGVETWRLAGFARTELEAGHRASVSIALEPRSFARWNEPDREWVIEADTYGLAISRSATDRVLVGELSFDQRRSWKTGPRRDQLPA